MAKKLFDTWTESYDNWFTTPTGQLVKKYESELLLELLAPQPGEHILDVGCGTGIFTQDVISSGAQVTGIDLSVPMLHKAISLTDATRFSALCADMCALPFTDNCFDKAFSMTAIEFVADAGKAISELNRVTRKGGCIVVTTLNNLSPWAEQRKKKAQNGHTLFQHITFRSPDDMHRLIPQLQRIETAIHFKKNEPVTRIPELEKNGKRTQADTGAFLAVQWNAD